MAAMIPKRTLVWALYGLAVALLVAGVVLLAFSPPNVGSILLGQPWQVLLLSAAISLYPLVGALIVTRRPENLVGQIFLVSGLLLSVWVFTAGYSVYGQLARSPMLPGSVAAGWVFSWVIVPVLYLTFVFLPLLFPDGRFGTRGRRLIGWYGVLACLFHTFTWTTYPDPDIPIEAAPFPIESVATLRLNESGWAAFVIAIVASVVSMVIRYRRSSGVERRQLQWFAFGVLLVGFVLVSATIGSDWPPAAKVADVLFPFAVAGLPVSAFVAIFKHDLYDLELVVSKTLTAGILLGLISVLYVAIVAGIGTLAGSATRSSVALAVVATALVALLFAPLRTWAQKTARRFVYGERADPYEVLAEFGHRMGSAPDPAEALAEISRLVQAGTGATLARVWLIVGDQLRLMAASSPGSLPEVMAMPRDGFPDIPGATHVVEVASRDRLLGAISWTLPAGHSSTQPEQRLVADLAAQAALVFENLRLIEELKDSRRRIVTAQDQERRRLERDLHDGVQQRLLALAMSLSSHAGSGASISNGAADEARSILAELRRLARGIHPAIVAEGGLVAALESLAERSPIPVILDVLELHNVSPTAEITLYYLAAEGLANSMRHSRASRIDIVVRPLDSLVEMSVADDGVGGADPKGSGLIGLADRVAAAGGRLNVDSPRGGGTQLKAVIPCG